MNEITFPWMPRELSPNARVHWAQKSKHAKLYKQDCFMLTKQAMANGFTLPDSEKLALWIDFYPPDKRIRDDDNLISSFKNGRDGMALALGIDDRKFRIFPYVKDQIGGMVKCRITTLPEMK